MSIVSYAQNFEDVLLWRALGDVDAGSYLDIGAHDPIVDSVSFAFYQAGWRGIHVEPTPTYAARLRQERPDESVIEAAVTDAAGPIAFYEVSETGLSTGDAEIASRHRELGYEVNQIVVPTVRLDQLLELAGDDLHWLKIDVEGMEADVLRSWGDSPCRPWVLVIEATYPSTQRPTHELWIDEILRRGYCEVHFDGLSRFFIHDDHASLAMHFASSPNVFDEFDITSTHFAADKIVRAYDAELETAREQASRREASLGRATEEALAQAKEAVEELRTLAAELNQAQEDALGAKAILQAAGEEHSVKLQSITAENERLRREASVAIERLAESEREQREAVGHLWSARQAAEATLRSEVRESQEKLRKISRDAASERLDLQKVHSVEISHLHKEFHATAQRLFAERTRGELALRREHEKRIGKIDRQLARERQEHEAVVTTLQKSSAEALEAVNFAREQQIAAQQQLIAAEQGHRKELESLQLGRQAAEVEHRAALRDARDRLQAAISAAETSAAAAGIERARLEERVLRLEAMLVQAEDGAAQQIAVHRAVLAQADELIRVAVRERPGRWQRLGEALGLGHPPLGLRALAGWSLPEFLQANSSVTTPPAPGSQSVMYSLAPPNVRNPYLRADSLPELLSWHGVDFVRCAYVTVLGRQPDPEGEAYYVDRIRRGHSKMEVLWQLRFSSEGRDHDPGIAGFDKMLRRHRNARRPFLGALIRALTGSIGAAPPERQLRVLKNDAAMAWHQQALGIADIQLQLGNHFEELAAIRSEGRVIFESVLSLQAQLADRIASPDPMEIAPPELHEDREVCCPPTLGPTAARLYKRIKCAS